MDQITQEERRLIDMAIAEGRVTTCPPRKHALGHMVYDGDKKSLRYADPNEARAQISAAQQFGSRKGGRKGRAPDPAVAKRRQRTRELAEAGLSGQEILDRLTQDGFTLSIYTLRADLQKMGVKLRQRGPGKKPARLDDVKAERAERKRAKIKDRRRFKVGAPASGQYSNTASADATGTIFSDKVADPSPFSRLLKDGANSSKIGGDVLVGRLRGAKIFTLTLEERATCPRSCAHWRGCYGNAMPHSTRWRHGNDLVLGLVSEVTNACLDHEKVLIRLHVLGHFWSPEYVWMWAGLLKQFPGLHLFGFTAWPADSEIGKQITEVRTTWPDRFMIRESGRTGEWGSFDITDPFPEKTIGDAIVCPEQRENNLGETKRHCGNCAVCWSTSAPVAFIRH